MKCSGTAYLASFVLLCSLNSATAQASTEATAAMVPPAEVSERLRHLLASPILPDAGEVIDRVALDAFYRGRDYQPAWCDAQGLNRAARNWLSVLEAAGPRGPRGAVPYLDSIHRQLAAATADRCAMLDLLLSDAFLACARATTRPLIEAQDMPGEWYLPRPQVDALAVLEDALASGDPGAAIAALEPHNAAYLRLRDRLEQDLQLLAHGGWPAFPAQGERLDPGVESAQVPLLREMLAITGDLAGQPQQGSVYDDGLQQAVRQFQRRHGLAVDGVIGKATRAALAVPLEQRIDQLRINLERSRWLPDDPGDRYIAVNTAAFELQALERGRPPLAMRVIVGKHDRETPVFMENMRYLVVNPYWHVPDTIARRDLIPALLRDQDYFAHNGIRVLSGRGPSAVEVDAQQVPWQDLVGEHYLPYRLRQDPGPRNSLGRIKFMLPNLHSVYLHDTPGRNLFNRPVRAFSSGCIRVEQPLELANFVLGNDRPAHDALATLLASGETGTVPLSQPVPVYLLYQTAWVDADGTLHFRDDIYRRDAKLLAALPARTPAPHAEKPAQTASLSLVH